VKKTAGETDRSRQVASRFSTIQSGLLQYVAANGRLPCPARPTLSVGNNSEGLEVDGGGGVCAEPLGTIPWRTLGLRQEDQFDAWGHKVSYRVFFTPSGLTRPLGASMVDCSTLPSAAGPLDAGNCLASHATPESTFLSGKGLKVQEFGQPLVTDAAYVLISHGPTGRGAYTASGTQLAPPSPTNAAEFPNLQSGAGSTFNLRAATDSGVSATDDAHFDDLLTYARVADLIRGAGRGGRNWPLALGDSSVVYDFGTVSSALGGRSLIEGLLGNNLGQQSLVINNISLQGLVGTAGAELTSLAVLGLIEPGLGVASASGTLFIESAQNESVRLKLPAAGKAIGISLSGFVDPVLPLGRHESAQLRFFLNGVQVGSSVTIKSCSPVALSTSFSVVVGQTFDEVQVVAAPLVNSAGTAVGNSDFLVAAIKSCASDSGPCRTALDANVPLVAQRCP